MQCRESGERCPLRSCSLHQHQHPEGAWQLRLGCYKIYNIYCSYYSHTCRPHGWDRIVGNLNWCHVCTNSFNRHIDIVTFRLASVRQSCNNRLLISPSIHIVYFASTYTVWVLLTLLMVNVPHHVHLLRTYDGMSTCGWFVYSSVVLVKCVSICCRTTHKWAQMWRGVSPLLSCARQYHKHHVYSQCLDYAQTVSI